MVTQKQNKKERIGLGALQVLRTARGLMSSIEGTGATAAATYHIS